MNPSSKTHCVIFDCDGTLVDGQASICEAMETAFAGADLAPPSRNAIRRIVGLSLPQALRISLPAMTNEFIALIKNTTLVLVVSILDLLGIAQASLADPNWVGMNMEAYAFSGAIYWLICFGLSRWSRSLEKRRRL